MTKGINPCLVDWRCWLECELYSKIDKCVNQTKKTKIPEQVKEYTSPKLEEYGALEDMTKGGIGSRLEGQSGMVGMHGQP